MRWLALALVFWVSAGAAQWRELTWVDPRLRWRTLDSANFSIHFADQHRPQARIVAEVAESIYPRLTEMLRWRPQAPIELVLLDSADFANGLASPLPFNYSAIFLSPPDEGELLQNREWLELVLTHELFHLVHLDKAQGPPDDLRRIFGRFPLFFPNTLQPRWVIEGLAVQAESDPARGYGRLGQSHFEGMMRSEVARGLRSLREVNADGRGFPLNRDYLYGGYFFAFLRERHGAKALDDFVESYSRNLVPFKVDSNARQATGKSMEELWDEFHQWLRARFAPLAGVSGSEAEIGRELVRAFSVSGPALAPGGERWYIQADGHTAPKLMRQAGEGRPETVRAVEQDARVAAAADGSVVLAAPDICRNYNYHYDLYRAGADGTWKRLTECARYRFAAPLGDGRLAAVRVEAGVAEVVLLDTGGAAQPLYRAAQGEALTGLAAKGSSVVVTSERRGRWSLLEVSRGRSSVLLSDAAIKHSPRFGDSEGEVHFVANYGNVYNVWSLERGSRRLARWSAAPYGVREISAPVGGEMLLTTLEADGDALRLHRLPTQPFERRAAPVAADADEASPVAAAEPADRPYSPWSSLRPRAWFPVINLAEGTVELGAAIAGQDALGLHRYYLAPRYEFTQRELLGDAEYVYDWRHGLQASRWMSVEGDDPDEAHTISERAQWISTWRALSLDRRFYWGLGGALARERLHQANLATASTQDERVLGLVAGVDTRRERWLSEGPSEGQQLRLYAETSSKLGGSYSGNVYRADWRGHLPLGKTVLALRWNEAYGQDRAEPFQLGGSRSDEIFILPVLNQHEFALRGFASGEPELRGHRARVVTVEWRTPLADIDRHSVVPPLGLNRLALNLFIDVGAAWDRGERTDYHRGIGAELMSELRFGYLFGLHARAGIARGSDPLGKTTAYLRVGRSF